MGSRLRWAGHIQRMSDHKLTKRIWKEEDRNCDDGIVLREMSKGQR